MFFTDPGLDLQISLFLLGVSFITGLVVFAVTKKIKLAGIIFSVLGNLSFLISIGSRMFIAYDLKWLQIFSLFIWPIINIFLIIHYFKNNGKKNQ
ncbi:MAG TPA: hypothetical protein PLK35_00755 [Candidatus Moranbacteria bacterium]|nr:hypothetical protein [Candidatus Moranbacteria bacterium]